MGIFGQTRDKPRYGKNSRVVQGFAASPDNIELTRRHLLAVPRPIAPQIEESGSLGVLYEPQRPRRGQHQPQGIGPDNALELAALILPPIRVILERGRRSASWSRSFRPFSRSSVRGMVAADLAAEAFLQLLTRPEDVLDQGMFELLVEGCEEEVQVTWKKVHLDQREETLDWGETQALQF